MIFKRALFTCILLISILGSTVTVFAENADDTVEENANTDNDTVSTNGYLESTDAIYFLRFVFNDAGGSIGNLSDDDIKNSKYYKMCTGQLAGTDEETEVIKAFLFFCIPK